MNEVRSILSEWKKIPREHTSIIKAGLVSLVGFLVLSILAILTGNFLLKISTSKATEVLNAQLSADTSYLLERGNSIAENPLIIKYTKDNNSYDLLAVLLHEKLDSNIGLMGVANKTGTIITRTKSANKRGDNVLLFSTIGRQLLTGGLATSTVTKSATDPTQVILNTGRYIYDGPDVVGSLYAGDLLDNSYAKEISQKLPKGTLVLFYTKEFGIYSTNIADGNLLKKIHTFFYPESEWIQHGVSNGTVNFNYRDKYFVKNVAFTDYDGPDTGVILLIPNYASSTVAQYIVIALTIFIYLFFSIYFQHHKKHSRELVRHYLFVLAGLAGLVFIIFVIYLLMFTNYVRHKREPFVLYNSTLRLQPESGLFNLEYEEDISVVVNTGAENVNAFNVSLKFDPTKIKVEEAAFEDSVCSHTVEKTINNKKGTIDISCITENLGFNGENGHIVDLKIKPLATGQFSIEFTDDSKVLADDGLGTNVLRQTTSGSYQVESALESLNLTSDTNWLNTKPIIFSPTHPNSSRAYSKNQATFVWSNQNQKSYAFSFDNNPDAVPRTTNITLAKSATFDIPTSGIYYLHLAPIYMGKLGPVAQYKIIADLEPPTDLKISASSYDVESGDIVHLVFSANDFFSGLEKTYYLNVDESLFYPVSHETYIPLIDPGTHTVRVRAYDKAGNYTEREIQITVHGSNFRQLISDFTNTNN